MEATSVFQTVDGCSWFYFRDLLFCAIIRRLSPAVLLWPPACEFSMGTETIVWWYRSTTDRNCFVLAPASIRKQTSRAATSNTFDGTRMVCRGMDSFNVRFDFRILFYVAVFFCMRYTVVISEDQQQLGAFILVQRVFSFSKFAAFAWTLASFCV